MAEVDATILVELERLRRLTSSDFIALAPFNEHAGRVRWKYALGSRNERYQQMVIKSGQGLAGSVLRHGRWVKLDVSYPHAEQARRDCPVMLSEQLKSAAAFPIKNDSDNPHSTIKGLLFIGKRTQHRYEQDEFLAVQESLPALAGYLKENAGGAAK